MSALPAVSSAFCFGGPLTENDFASLRRRFVSHDMAIAQGLIRVSSEQGRELVNRKRGDMSGIAIPYMLPTASGIVGPRAWRLRRDNPDLEMAADGSGVKERGKYMGAPGSANLLFFAAGTLHSDMRNPAVPVIVTEGEFKTMALQCAAEKWLKDHPGSLMPFVPIGVGGVYNWQGVIGKAALSNGARADVRGPISDLDHIVCPGRDVYIAYDADIVGKSQVLAARTGLRQELRKRGANGGVIEWDAALGKGIDDFLASQGVEAFFELFVKAKDTTKPGGWKSRLAVKKDGMPLPILANALKALRHAPEWDGVLRYNEFSRKVEIAGTPPYTRNEKGEWSNSDDCLLTEWLQDKGIIVPTNTAGQAADTIAHDHTYHPVRDYLRSLIWDGDPRVDTWLNEYMGVAPSNYSAVVGRCWLISAVARALTPGCKVDTGLIIEGKQGTFKSTALRILASSEWFSDHLEDLGSRDAAAQLGGVWIMEFAELDKFGKTATNKLKQFWTQQEDRHRFAFAKRVVSVPRSCVFVATTNEEEYFEDETGGRRFWPVQCGAINIEALKRDRDQLWAEATHLFLDGAKWYLDNQLIIEEAAQQQAARYKTDPWQDIIVRWLDDRQEVEVTQILQTCLTLSFAQITQREKNRVVKILVTVRLRPYCRSVGISASGQMD